MRHPSFCQFAIGAILTAIAVTVSANDKDDAIKIDRKQIEGTWKVVAFEVDGKKSKEEVTKQLTVVNGPNGIHRDEGMGDGLPIH